MSKFGLYNLNIALMRSDFEIETKKVLAWAQVLNLAELKTLCFLVCVNGEYEFNRRDISKHVDLDEGVVAYCLDSLYEKMLVSRIKPKRKKAGRPKNPTKGMKEIEYQTPRLRYVADISRCPFPEGMEIMSGF